MAIIIVDDGSRPVTTISSYQAQTNLALMDKLSTLDDWVGDSTTPQYVQVGIDAPTWDIRAQWVKDAQVKLGWSDQELQEFFNAAALIL